MQHLQSSTTLQGGKYKIERVLGQGGFGITYLATDIALDRKVAVKEFFPKDYCDRNGSTSHITIGTESAAEFVQKLKAKFLKEVRNIAKLDHPGIIRIHAAFEENNTAYYVMDYIEGENLSEMVQRNGPLPEQRAVAYIEKVGEALQYIHARHINHLDIKPANIMVRCEDDRPILIDFGLSKQYDTEGQQTSTTPTGISHGYAPMEQYNDGGVKEFSPQTDIYSLAATLYFLLSGVTPPQATKLVDEDLTFSPSVPANFIMAISKGMATSRKQRYDMVYKFLAEITEREAEDTIVEFVPPKSSIPKSATDGKSKTPDKLSTKYRSKKWYWLAGAIIAIVVIIVIVWKLTLRPTTDTINGHEWVDLGLPSGIKWATCNIGAFSPSDYGNHYAWGETTVKSEYKDENCKTCGKNMNDISGIVQYDVARAKWGNSWRLPTMMELEELEKECTWTWVTQDDHNGYWVTGPNNKSIFLPVAGLDGENGKEYVGQQGFYWSSTPYEDNIRAGSLILSLNGIDNSNIHILAWPDRKIGMSVRPVVSY